MKHYLRTEPVAITAMITALVGVLTTLGVIDETLAGAIVTAIGAVLVVVRQAVTPVDRT
jgi:hypothetical protein